MKFKITNKIKKITLSLIGSILVLAPYVLAYPATLPAYDLYGVFVEAVFGGFWLSVLGLAGVMFILLGPIGGLSQWTAMTYCMIFIYAMGMGYSQILINVGMWSALVVWFVVQLMKYANSASTA